MSELPYSEADELERRWHCADGQYDTVRDVFVCAIAALRQAQARIAELEAQMRSADAYERSINEALNSGDGVYRP
jgi:hypothetical protein